MFEQSTLSSGPASRRIFGTFMGFAGQAALVTVAVVAPMVFPQVLPRALLVTGLTAPTPPPAPPGNPGNAVIRPKPTHQVASQIRNGVVFVPAQIPPAAQILVDPDPLPSGPMGSVGVPGGIGTASGSGSNLIDQIVLAGTPPIAARPAPRAEAAPAPAPVIQRVRVGSGVRMARLVSRVEPVYPPMAKQMRVSGVVELEGVIATDGRLKELRVKSGHVLLARAAIEAVQQWVYEPTTLNGTPVEVIAPITVTFILH